MLFDSIPLKKLHSKLLERIYDTIYKHQNIRITLEIFDTSYGTRVNVMHNAAVQLIKDSLNAH